MSDLIDYIVTLTNKLEELKGTKYDSKELEYGIQKLSEAIYCLSYVEEDIEDKGGDEE